MNSAVRFMLNSHMYTEFFYMEIFKDTEEFKCANRYFRCPWNRQKLSSKMYRSV